MTPNLKKIFNFEDQTNHSIQNEKRLKKILKLRTSAFVVDLVVILLFNKLCTISYTLFLEKYFSTVPKSVQEYLFLRLNKLEIITFAIIFWGYFSFCNFMMDGQTPGKVIFHLKVKNPENSPLTLRQSLLRTMGYFICYFTGSFLFLFPWFNKENKGIPDWISNTFVENFVEDRSKIKKTVNSYDWKNENSPELSTFPGQNQTIQPPNEQGPQEILIEQEIKKAA